MGTLSKCQNENRGKRQSSLKTECFGLKPNKNRMFLKTLPPPFPKNRIFGDFLKLKNLLLKEGHLRMKKFSCGGGVDIL